ncbi:MAG: hypothetical protein JWP97_5129 [Labilithrix sp.]|nr:hypothetical protein [Labilithrix sp.]
MNGRTTSPLHRRWPARLAVTLAALTALGVAAPATLAHADAPANEAAAEALFTEARALIDAGRVAEGCTKLEASQSLDPGTGTLLHLADCYERTGRTASAWARFREAAARAAHDHRADWETIARTRAAELEPKLARLRIDAPAGASVRRDGVDLPAGALGAALPIDPGAHVVDATAPGKQPWRGSVDAVAARTVTITVPPLVAVPAGETPTSTGSSLRPAGFVVGGIGVVGLGIGAALGLSAISLNNRSKDVCPEPGLCADAGARDDAASARRAATISTTAFVAGGVLLAAGITLVVLAPHHASPSSASARARLRLAGSAALVEGTW